MSLYGWIILILSVGGTTSCLIGCFLRVIREHKKTDRNHSPADLDPRKTDLSNSFAKITLRNRPKQ